MNIKAPEIGVGKAASGAKASLGRLTAWAKKNPALVVAIVAGVAVLALVVSKRGQSVRRTSGAPEGDPLGGVGMGNGVPEVPPGDIVFPTIPELPPAPTIPTTPSNGGSSASKATTTYVEAYTPPSPMVTDMQKMGIDIVHKIRDDPSIPSNIGDIFASNYQKAEMLAKREKARITARERKTRGALAARILARRSSTTPTTDRKRPYIARTRREFKAIDSSRDDTRRRKGRELRLLK